MTNYAIDDGDSNLITSGLQGYDHAKKVAQEIANERNEPVYLYEDEPCEDDEPNEPLEEIKPERNPS